MGNNFSLDASEPRLELETSCADNIMAFYSDNPEIMHGTTFESQLKEELAFQEYQKTRTDIPGDIFKYAVPRELAERAAVVCLIAPQKPWYLIPSNFDCNMPLESIVEMVHNCLNSLDRDIDYEFVRHECAFHGVSLSYSTYCDFHIRIYQNLDKSFCVEFQKMERDSDSMEFNRLCRFIQCALTDPTFNIHTYRDPTDCDMVWDDDYVPNVEQELHDAILMAREADDTYKIEASRVFADFASNPNYFNSMVSAVPTLITLLTSTCNLARQHSMMALVAISEDDGCIEAIKATRKVNIFAILMSYASNGPYHTAKMRRMALCLLKNLVDANPSEIIKSVGVEAIQVWMSNVETLTDDRIKETCTDISIVLRTHGV